MVNRSPPLQRSRTGREALIPSGQTEGIMELDSFAGSAVRDHPGGAETSRQGTHSPRDARMNASNGCLGPPQSLISPRVVGGHKRERDRMSTPWMAPGKGSGLWAPGGRLGAAGRGDSSDGVLSVAPIMRQRESSMPIETSTLDQHDNSQSPTLTARVTRCRSPCKGLTS